MTISAIQPRPYVITTATIPFVDACTGVGSSTLGTVLDDDEFTGRTLPASFAGFQLFGEAVPATHRVVANGWMSWNPASRLPNPDWPRPPFVHGALTAGVNDGKVVGSRKAGFGRKIQRSCHSPPVIFFSSPRGRRIVSSRLRLLI